MSINSKIEWTGKTWNPIRARLKADTPAPTKKDPLRILPAGKWGYHCERVSPGCGECYACTMNGRTLPAWGTGLDFTVPNRNLVEIYLDQEELTAPLKWKKPTKIFPCSMTDWCADFVPDEMRDRMLAVAALTPQHTYQFLTKRASRMREWATRTVPGVRIHTAIGRVRKTGWGNGPEPAWPLPNVWLGVSVEDKQRADERIPDLLETPAAVRFLSVEPLLDLISFRWAKWDNGLPHPRRKSKLRSVMRDGRVVAGAIDHLDGLRMLDWVICGGESGPGARPMETEWVESLREECVEAGVPFFFKQWGGAKKKDAGRLLDGRTWDEMPEVRA